MAKPSTMQISTEFKAELYRLKSKLERIVHKKLSLEDVVKIRFVYDKEALAAVINELMLLES